MTQTELVFDTTKYRKDFGAWLGSNNHIWRAFATKANEIWYRGRRHYSARTIVEVLRHESALAEVGGEWKISNNFIPDLARMYQEAFPDRADLFETRLMPGGLRAA